MMGGYGGWWALMWIWMAAFWLLVVVGITWLVWRAGQPRLDTPSAEKILPDRLARGEIDIDQYRALTHALGERVRQSPRGRAPTQILLAMIAAAVIIALVSGTAIAASRGDWDMFDHMSRLMGGGSNTANAPLTVGAATETVTISDFAFSPGNLQVPVGATVTWVNRDSASHDATSRDGSWKTATLASGSSGALTFDTPGEYDYYCSIHPSMKAHLSVK